MYIPPKNNAEDSKPRPEKRHIDKGGPTVSNEDNLGGKACFMHLDNRKSINEYAVEGKMGSKMRV